MRKLSKKEYADLLSKHSCVKLNNANASWEEFSSPKVYFECDGNFYIKEDNLKNELYLFENRKTFLESLELDEQENIFSPLKDKNYLITNIDKHKESIIKNFLKEINYNRVNNNLKEIDLHELNIKINEYSSLEDLYKKYYLNFIVFLGELVREKKQGNWEYKTNISKPTELIPYFIDSSNKNYEFLINVFLVKEISRSIREEKEFDLFRILRLLEIDWNNFRVGNE
ncbi:hypothetical protein [Tenacibaculum jejuense]|nr:hypothetical protein [Tenacibaculum jejuense]